MRQIFQVLREKVFVLPQNEPSPAGVQRNKRIPSYCRFKKLIDSSRDHSGLEITESRSTLEPDTSDCKSLAKLAAEAADISLNLNQNLNDPVSYAQRAFKHSCNNADFATDTDSELNS